MLKPKYDREDQIPENLKGAYVADAKTGTWVLDELDAEHPVVAKRDELLAENTRYKGLNTKLQNEKAQLESKAIPEGHVAVKAEDAPIIEQVKTLNIPVKELGTLKEENDRFKRQETETNARNLRLAAAEKLGYTNADAFAHLAKDLDIVQEGDAHFVNVKNDKGEVEKKPLTTEFVESSETFKPFLSSLTTQPAKPGAGPNPRPQGGSSSVFDKIRENAKSQSEAAKPAPGSDIDSRFGRQAA